MKFIIEHMELEVYDWCLLEYKHMSKIVGKSNLIFTNVKKQQSKLKNLGKVHKESIKELLNIYPKQEICLLDMDAKTTLTTKDKTNFKYFLFGGILGDNPRKHRTQTLKSKIKTKTRNLSQRQMSTDTAVYVTHKILKGKKLEQLKFTDELEIVLDENKGATESVILPFRYVVEKNKVILPPGLIDYLKNKKSI